MITGRQLFTDVMKQRLTEHPFDGRSAYKVRESRDNLRREIKVVASITAYRSASPRVRCSSSLVSCTSEDTALRLKQVPNIIIHELGYNLIPGIEALTLEGVSATDISAFISTISARVNQLVADCGVVHQANSRSIKGEYARLRAGKSDLPRLCKEATDIAELAVAFCHKHGVL